MNESLSRIIAVANDTTEVPQLRDVEALAEEYPFFVLPAVLALRRIPHEEMPDTLCDKLMNLIALNSPDPVTAFMLANVNYEDWVRFYPAEATTVSTNDTISKFLETYGHSDPREEALLERLIFNPTPDYSSVLAREEEISALPEEVDPSDSSQDALINSFILKHKDDESDLFPREQAESAISEDAQPAPEEKAPEHHTPEPASSPMYDSSLSESLAKIYIKQKRYDKAFEIIHTLSLNNPKKSAYFADQLRFLRKLIINRNGANKQK